jgi:hypothetical protein
MKLLFVFIIGMLSSVGMLCICEYVNDGIVDADDMKRTFLCSTVGAVGGSIVFLLLSLPVSIKSK